MNVRRICSLKKSLKRCTVESLKLVWLCMVDGRLVKKVNCSTGENTRIRVESQKKWIDAVIEFTGAIGIRDEVIKRNDL